MDDDGQPITKGKKKKQKKYNDAYVVFLPFVFFFFLSLGVCAYIFFYELFYKSLRIITNWNIK